MQTLKTSALILGITLLAALSNTAFAQLNTHQIQGFQAKKQLLIANRPMSAGDKAELKALLSELPSNMYQVRFSDGTSLGSKNLKLGNVKQGGKIRPGGGGEAAITFISASPNEVIFIYTSDFQQIQSKLGQEKALKLQNLVARYQ